MDTVDTSSLVSGKKKATAIYLLRDPRTGEPRYIGKSTRPHIRINSHLHYGPSCRMRRWIAELKSLGLKPVMENLEWCEGDSWIEREQLLIADYKARFPGIMNIRRGGESPLDEHYTDEVLASMRGRKRSAETRLKMSLSAKKRRASPETRARIGAAHKGRKHSPEWNAKISAAHMGRWVGRPVSAETRAKISAANKGKNLGRVYSPETIEKMRIAHTGKKLPPETVARMREAQLKRWADVRANLPTALPTP